MVRNIFTNFYKNHFTDRIHTPIIASLSAKPSERGSKMSNLTFVARVYPDYSHTTYRVMAGNVLIGSVEFYEDGDEFQFFPLGQQSISPNKLREILEFIDERNLEYTLMQSME